MQIIEIAAGSQAAKALAAALADPDTYLVRIADDDGVKIKINESVWSPPLASEVK